MKINGIEVNFSLAKISDFKKFMPAKNKFANSMGTLQATKEKTLEELLFDEALTMFTDLFGKEMANKVMRVDEGITFTALYSSIADFFEAVRKQEEEIMAIKQRYDLAMIKK